MVDNLLPGLGTDIGISAVLPTTFDTAPTTGYPSLIFLSITDVTDIPSFGPSHDVVNHTPLKTGIVAKFHGAKNNGSMSIPVGLDPTDPGQIAVQAALASKARVAWALTYSDGTKDYFAGKVMSFTKSAGIGSVVSGEFLVEIETDFVSD